MIALLAIAWGFMAGAALAADPPVQVRLIGPDPLMSLLSTEPRLAAALGPRYRIGVEPRPDRDDVAASARIALANAAPNAVVLTELDVVAAYRSRHPAAELRFVPLEPVCAFAFARRDRGYADMREAIGDRWLEVARIDPGAAGGRADRMFQFLQQVDNTFGHVRIERSDGDQVATRLLRRQADIALVVALPDARDAALEALLADRALAPVPIRPILAPAAARDAELPYFPARIGSRDSGDAFGVEGYETVCVSAGLAVGADLGDRDLARRAAGIKPAAPGPEARTAHPVERLSWVRPAVPPAPAAAAPERAVTSVGSALGRLLADAAAGAGEVATGALAGLETARWLVAEGVWEAAYALGVNSTPLRIAAQAAPEAAAPVAAAPAVVAVPVPVPERRIAPPPPASSPVAAPRGERPAAPEDDDPIDLLAREIPVLRELGFDQPFRRDDGSFFVPKPVQRLYGIRTVAAAPERVALTATLPGQIVPDPNTHGSVEPSVLGRIEPPESGLPFVGQHVAKGQVLGYVVPAVGVLERSQARREIARLNSEIAMSQALLDRLRQFFFVPFREGRVIQEEMKLEGLRRERAAVMPMLAAQEILRASTAGVISASAATTGKIVKPGDTVFEIVDPDHLWVQAIAPGMEAAETAGRVGRAYAVTPEGQALPLAYIGSGLSLQQQAVPLLFRIEQPIAGLRVGRPVSVIVESTQTTRSGVVLPRESVVNGASGVDEVWEQTGPETFAAHPVRTEPIDGERILVVAGVASGSRVVTRGARLLIQLK
ncbi:MAG: HlyD family efflux transporter periplasmic adaptor subunit [Alphaproteobacteria bacterium]